MVQLAVYLRSLLARPLRNDHGATATEYVLMAFLIAVVIIAAVSAVGVKVLSMFTAAAAAI